MTRISFFAPWTRAGFWPAFGLLLAFVVVGHATPAKAQFRNNGLQFNLGWMGLGSTENLIRSNVAPGSPDKLWSMNDQATFGVGYFRAIGYELFWENQTVIGLGEAISNQANANIGTAVVSLNVSTGLRYNILDERHRPFLSGHIQYLQVLNPTPELLGNDTLGGVALWVGARVGGGYEWFFGDEMSVMGELNGVLYADLLSSAIVKPSAIGRLSWNVYF